MNEIQKKRAQVIQKKKQNQVDSALEKLRQTNPSVVLAKPNPIATTTSNPAASQSNVDNSTTEPEDHETKKRRMGKMDMKVFQSYSHTIIHTT